MDQTILVSSGQKLVSLLDQTPVRPRVAMWLHNTDTDTWRLWIVPDRTLTDKREFYRRVAEVITGHRDEVPGLDAGDIEFVPETHPAIQGMKRMIRVEGLNSIYVSNNMVNGFYVPDGIVLRMAA